MKVSPQKRHFISDKFPVLDHCSEDLDPEVSRDTDKRIEGASEIERLAGGVAHEFNNLFAAISLNSELLEDHLGKENKQVKSLLRVAFRGSELTRKMLSFSRLQQLSPRVLDLGDLVEGMIDCLLQTLGGTIRMEFIRARDLWPINADPVHLENALVNLAGNGRDAMPLGGRLVVEMANVTVEPEHAGTQLDLAPGDYVVLSVSDTGRGIKPDVIERVFEPFFTTKDVGQGIGLGLSMVFGFARQSCGHVTIESELGRGTMVKLYLPRAIDEVR